MTIEQDIRDLQRAVQGVREPLSNHHERLVALEETIRSVEARFMDHTEGTNSADHENRLHYLERALEATSGLEDRLLQVEGMASVVTDIQGDQAALGEMLEAFDVKMRAFEKEMPPAFIISGPAVAPQVRITAAPSTWLKVPPERDVVWLAARLAEKNERIRHLEQRIAKQKANNTRTHAILKEWKDDCAAALAMAREEHWLRLSDNQDATVAAGYMLKQIANQRKTILQAIDRGFSPVPRS